MGPAGRGYRLVDVDLSRGEIGLLDKAVVRGARARRVVEVNLWVGLRTSRDEWKEDLR